MGAKKPKKAAKKAAKKPVPATKRPTKRKPAKKRKSRKKASTALVVLPKPTIYEEMRPDSYAVAVSQVLDEPSELVIKAICGMMRDGVPAQIACRVYGVSYTQYEKWRKIGIENVREEAQQNTFGTFVKALDQAEAMAEADILRSATRGYLPAGGMLDILERRFPSRYARKSGATASAEVPVKEDPNADPEAALKGAAVYSVLEVLTLAQHGQSIVKPEDAPAAIPLDIDPKPPSDQIKH